MVGIRLLVEMRLVGELIAKFPFNDLKAFDSDFVASI